MKTYIQLKTQLLKDKEIKRAYDALEPRYKQLTKDIDFASFLKQQLKDPAIKKAYEEEGLKLKELHLNFA